MDNEYQIVKQNIEDRIVRNENNEITADVLRPILIDMLDHLQNRIGDTTQLNTEDKTSLVNAINEVLSIINENQQGIQVYSGLNDPNNLPPVSYSIGDMYSRLDGQNNAIGLYIYTGINWLNLTAINTFNQDNIDIRFRILVEGNSILEAVNSINSIPPYTVNDKQSVWYIATTLADASDRFSTYKYKLMNKGKGTYGIGGTQITSADLELIYVNTPTTEDVETDPTTDIVNYGNLSNQNVSEWLNTQTIPIIIQPQTDGYTLFKGAINGLEQSYLFVGVSGTYGTGQTQSVLSDFQLLSETTPVGVQSVTGYAVDNTDNLNPVVKNIVDLPVNFEFYLTTNPDPTSSGAMYSTYITDERRLLNLAPFIPSTVTRIYTYEVEKVDENTLFIIGQEVLSGAQDDAGNYFALALRECKIIDNILIVGRSEYRNMNEIFRNPTTNVPNNIHGMNLNRGYIFANTRTDYVGSPIQVFKINPFNLQDYKYVNFPLTTGFVSNLSGGTTDILCYKNYLYLLNAQNPSSSTPAYLLRIDENLNTPEVVFQLNNPDINRRVPRVAPFLIYNDKLYVPLVQGGSSGSGKLGLSVYDLFKKILIAELPPAAINATIIGSGVAPTPHWMAEHNGKIIIHTAAGGSNQSRSLVRFDSTTLALEASTPLPSPITDDNLITREGYVILNPENSTTAYQLKIRYDFANNEVPVNYSPNYFWALGNPRNKSFESSLKTKLSEFQGDYTLQNATDAGATTTKTIVITDPSNALIKTTISGGTITIELPDGRKIILNAGIGLGLANSSNKNAIITNAGGTGDYTYTLPIGKGGTFAMLDDITNGGGGSVTSVAGKTGAVTLEIADINALTSALAGKQAAFNGSGYIFFNGTSFSYITSGTSNDLVLAGGLTTGGQSYVNSRGLNTYTGSNVQIAANQAIGQALFNLQAQINGTQTAITVTGNVITPTVGNSKYISNAGTLVSIPLPLNSAAAIGNSFDVCSLSTGGWRITQPEAGTIIHASSNTTLGTTGYIQSSGRYDSIRLEKIAANEWVVRYVTGTPTIV